MNSRDNRLTREAALHALAIHDEESEGHELEKAVDWTLSSPENEAAFGDVEAFLDACRELSASGMIPSTVRRAPTLRSRLRRTFSRPMAATAAVLLVICAPLALFILAWPMLQQDHAVLYASKRGETRTIWLEDGSSIKLAGDTEVNVAYRRARRAIELRRGEAAFAVAPDARRPFVVSASHGSSTAVGTEFNVRRLGDRVTVTVVHGLVDVAVSRKHSDPVRIGRTMQVSYTAGGAMGPAQYADLSRVLAWQQGRLLFVREPLANVLVELNRYSRTPIRLADRRLGAKVISGSVEVGLIPEWLRGLATATGMAVTVQDSEIVVGLSQRADDARLVAEAMRR